MLPGGDVRKPRDGAHGRAGAACGTASGPAGSAAGTASAACGAAGVASGAACGAAGTAAGAAGVAFTAAGVAAGTAFTAAGVTAGTAFTAAGTAASAAALAATGAAGHTRPEVVHMILGDVKGRGGKLTPAHVGALPVFQEHPVLATPGPGAERVGELEGPPGQLAYLG